MPAQQRRLSHLPADPGVPAVDLRRRRRARGPAGAPAAQADRRRRPVHGRAARGGHRARRELPAGANAALRVFGADLSMAAAVPEVDLVHSHTWYANLGGIWPGCSTTSRTWSARTRSSRTGRGRPSSSAAATSCRRGPSGPPSRAADAVIAVSAGMRTDTLDSYTDLDPAKVHVVKNGIDTDEFAPDTGTDVVTGLGMDLDRPTVVFVGRITRQKGLIHLVRAAEQLDPDTQLVLLAGAPDTPEIAAADRRRVRAPAVQPRQRDLDRGDAAPGPGPPGAVARHRVRLPVGLRAARHRQPRGDGLRDRRRGLGGRRHPRGRGRRRDRLPGPVRPGPGRRPGGRRGVRGRDWRPRSTR